MFLLNRKFWLSVFRVWMVCVVVALVVRLVQLSFVTERQAALVGLSERGYLATPMQVRLSASSGDADVLRELGELGVDFDSVDEDGMDAVHLALDHERWEALGVVRDYALENDRVGGGGKTPVMKLLDRGDLELAQSFVDDGGGVDFRMMDGGVEVPAVVYYLLRNDEARFNFVAGNAKDLDVRGAYGRVLLQIAMEGGYTAETLALVRYGADLSKLDLPGGSVLCEIIENPLRYALSDSDQVRLLGALLARGVDVNEADGGGERPLSVAIREGRFSAFSLLMSHVVKDQSYVWDALRYNRSEMLRELLVSGWKSDEVGAGGETPLVSLLKRGGAEAAEMVGVLLDHGADADQVAAEGQRAVFVAIVAGKSLTAKALINHEKGADVHGVMNFPVSRAFFGLFNKRGLCGWYCRNVRGLSPLMIAVLRDDLGVAHALVKKGARRGQRTEAKTYPIQMAASMKNVRMQQLVLGVPFDDGKQARRFVVDLSQQKVFFYKWGKVVRSSRCSTGKKDYRTPVGEYVITSKEEDKVSNIYKDAEMPYFQRFSCKDIGFHEGATYAGFLSHGCIRLPMSSAKYFYKHSRVGDRVTIRR